MRAVATVSAALLLTSALGGHAMAQATHSASPPGCCASLDEVRTNIDRIDSAMIALMAERAGYVAAAAKFKPDAASVHDGARVERIIARVKQLAAEQRLPPLVAEATFRAMIAAFTDYERTLVKP